MVPIKIITGTARSRAPGIPQRISGPVGIPGRRGGYFSVWGGCFRRPEVTMPLGVWSVAVVYPWSSFPVEEKLSWSTCDFHT